MTYLTKNLLVLLRSFVRSFKKNILKSPVINYFNDSFHKNVLITYVVKPFKSGIDYSHTNSIESLEIAKIFRSLQFNVDIAEYNYEGYLNFGKYDIIIGFGEPLIRSFSCSDQKKITRIYYGTGMHVSVQNHNTLKRIEEVYKKKGVWLFDSGRIVEKTWSPQTTSVDAMIVLGNKIVVDSYRKYFEKGIYNIPPSFYKEYDFAAILEQKNFDSAKKNFLWLGGNGLIHKGLDLLLDIFTSLPDLHLHICGPVDMEKGFKDAYCNELFNLPNIHTYGFIEIRSPLFLDLLKKCAFVIYPSCSEGGGAAVLNVIGNGGLVPLLSKESSIDVNDYGFTFDTLTVEDIQHTIVLSQTLTTDEIKKRSVTAGSIVSTVNSIRNFSVQFESALRSIIQHYEL